jgi:hypothetical protein
MKHILCALLGISLLASAVQTSRAVDAVWNYSVEASATVQSSPAKITLSWPQDSVTTPSSYTVYRKAPSATSWGNAIATLSGTQLSYTDTGVSVGQTYEYRIVKNCGSYTGYGYVQSAINAPYTGDTTLGDVQQIGYSLNTIGPDSNLAGFLNTSDSFSWTIMAGDSVGGNSATPDARRYLTTTSARTFPMIGNKCSSAIDAFKLVTNA